MNKRGYVITHTHWDREWRYPIWESRVYLAEMLDELLEVLDTQPEYKGFLFDGQTVFLEDYLMVRPENKERLKKYIEAGRILIGPWYTLPDIYPVSGESLIRNLLKGDRVSREYGRKLNIGYESFGWGQPSQFPQIYKGFGIDTVIVAKRVSERRAPESEFIWEGKDGTQVLATRLGEDARANFYMNTYMEAMSGRAYKSNEFRYQYGQSRLYHRADKIGSEQDFFMLNHKEHVHTEHLRELAMRSWNAMNSTILKEDRVLMDGSDSTCAQTRLIELIEKINTVLEEEGITLSHNTLEEYVALMKQKLADKNLRVIKGELRDGPAPSVSANALMTRYPVKRKHRMAERMMMEIAEPLAVFGAMTGKEYDRNYLERARDYLLSSQSHDSINGVVQDKTMRDEMYRLDQCIELSDCVKEGVIRYIVQNLSCSEWDSKDILVLLVNPLPIERREIIEMVIDTPQEQEIWNLDAYDSDGTALDCAHISRKEVVTPTVNRHTRPEPYYADRHEMILDTGRIPAGGYKVIQLRPKETFARKQKFWPPTRMSDGRELGTGTSEMENKYLKVMVQPNGTVRLLNKKTGYLSGELNYLESGGDVGDYWIHYPPYFDKTYTSQSVSADIWMEENTPLQTSICVSFQFRLPAYAMRPEAGIQGDSRRSDEMRELPIWIRYTLKKDAKKLEVTLRVRNTAKDHRLTVNFDTGVLAEGASAGGHFCVDYRNKMAEAEENGMHYTEMDKFPMQRFVDVSNGKLGFGVLSDDFLEYDTSRPGRLSCTLFRAVRNIICTEFRSGSSYPSQEGGQLLEEMEYCYALMPHEGGWDNAALQEESRTMTIPVIPVQFGMAQDTSGNLPAEKSFLEIKHAQVSCVKFCEGNNNMLIRIFNPCSKTKNVSLKITYPVVRAWEVNMKEERMKELALNNGEISMELMSDRIMTIEMQLREEER